eukprot:m.729167 g.729167  ORF g.729167 m.729167 type:complete len:1593 (+) comp23047_c0_seq5:60-4838(+)
MPGKKKGKKKRQVKKSEEPSGDPFGDSDGIFGTVVESREAQVLATPAAGGAMQDANLDHANTNNAELLKEQDSKNESCPPEDASITTEEPRTPETGEAANLDSPASEHAIEQRGVDKVVSLDGIHATETRVLADEHDEVDEYVTVGEQVFGAEQKEEVKSNEQGTFAEQIALTEPETAAEPVTVGESETAAEPETVAELADADKVIVHESVESADNSMDDSKAHVEQTREEQSKLEREESQHGENRTGEEIVDAHGHADKGATSLRRGDDDDMDTLFADAEAEILDVLKRGTPDDVRVLLGGEGNGDDIDEVIHAAARELATSCDRDLVELPVGGSEDARPVYTHAASEDNTAFVGYDEERDNEEDEYVVIGVAEGGGVDESGRDEQGDRRTLATALRHAQQNEARLRESAAKTQTVVQSLEAELKGKSQLVADALAEADSVRATVVALQAEAAAVGAAHATECDALRASIDKLQTENKRMIELFAGKELEVQDANALCRELSTRAVTAETKVDEVCKVNDDLLEKVRHQAAEHAVDVAKLDELLNEREITLVKMEDNLRAKARKIEEEQATAEDLRKELESEKIGRAGDTAALQARLDRKSAEFAQLRELQNQDDHEKEDLRAAMAATQAHAVQVQKAAIGFEDKAKKDIERMSNLVAMRDDALKTVTDNHEELTKAYEDVKKQLDLSDGRIRELLGGNPSDPRTEIVRLRMKICTHDGEKARLEARVVDLQAQLDGVQQALKFATTQIRSLQEKIASTVDNSGQLAVAENMSKLLEEEAKTLRSRISNEVSARVNAETALSTAEIDLKHAKQKISDLEQQVATAESKASLQESLYGSNAGYGSSGIHSTSQFGATTTTIGGIEYFNPASYSGSASSSMSELDHMRDAKLAEDRAKAAERREQALLDRLHKIEHEAAGMRPSGGGGDLAGYVGIDVHTRLLDLADQRTRDAERRCREVETDMVSLKNQQRVARGLQYLSRDDDVVVQMLARVDACIVGIKRIHHAETGSALADASFAVQAARDERAWRERMARQDDVSSAAEASFTAAVAAERRLQHGVDDSDTPKVQDSTHRVKVAPMVSPKPVKKKKPTKNPALKDKPAAAVATPGKIRDLVSQHEHASQDKDEKSSSPSTTRRQAPKKLRSSLTNIIASSLPGAVSVGANPVALMKAAREKAAATRGDDAGDGAGDEFTSDDGGDTDGVGPSADLASDGKHRDGDNNHTEDIGATAGESGRHDKALDVDGDNGGSVQDDARDEADDDTTVGRDLPDKGSHTSDAVTHSDDLVGSVRRAPSLTGQFARPQIQRGKRLPSRRGRGSTEDETETESTEGGQPAKIAEAAGMAAPVSLNGSGAGVSPGTAKSNMRTEPNPAPPAVPAGGSILSALGRPARPQSDDDSDGDNDDWGDDDDANDSDGASAAQQSSAKTLLVERMKKLAQAGPSMPVPPTQPTPPSTAAETSAASAAAGGAKDSEPVTAVSKKPPAPPKKKKAVPIPKRARGTAENTSAQPVKPVVASNISKSFPNAPKPAPSAIPTEEAAESARTTAPAPAPTQLFSNDDDIFAKPAASGDKKKKVKATSLFALDDDSDDDWLK